MFDPLMRTGGNSRMFPIMPVIARGKRHGTMNRVPRSADPAFITVSIPWDMVRTHELQAMRNHCQNLETLARRGGLTADEAMAILEDRTWREMDAIDADEKLFRVTAAWIAAARAEFPR